MSKKKPTTPASPKQRTKKPEYFSSLSLNAQIAAARPFARRLLIEGIDTYQREENDLNERVLVIAAGCSTDGEGMAEFFGGISEKNRVHVSELLHIARAYGPATGLPLRPERFTGGAR